MKRRSWLALLMVTMLCLSMVLSGCGKEAEEPLTLEIAMENTADALCTDNNPYVLKDMDDKKVVTASVDGLFTNVLNMDLANKSFYDQLSLTVEGETLNANIYCDGDNLAATAPELLGSDQALGIRFSTLMTDLKTSGLLEALDGGSGGSFSGIVNLIPELKKIQDEGTSEQAVKEVTDALKKALEGVESTQSEGTVTVDGEEVKAVLFTYTMTKEDYKKLVEALLKIFEDRYNKTMDAMIAAGVITAEEAAAESPFADVRDDLNSGFEKVGMEGITTFAVNPDNRCIMRIDSTFKGTSEEEGNLNATMELVLGKDPAESGKYTLSLKGTGDEGEMDLNLSLTTTTEGAVDTVAVVMAGNVDGETMNLNFTAAYDNDSKAYTLNLVMDEDAYMAKGKMETTNTKLTFTLDEVKAGDEVMPVGLVLSIEDAPECEIPAVPEYTNILTDPEMSAMLGMLVGSGGMDDSWDEESWDEESWDEEAWDEEFWDEEIPEEVTLG